MNDILSYKQLYNELETLNTSAYDALLHEDFEGFQNTVDEFINSGIMEQENFATAREAYRYSSMPFTLNGLWISVDSCNPLDKPISAAYAWPIQELKKRDVYPVYAYLTEQKEIKPDESKLASKRTDALENYIELYKNLYTDVLPKTYFTAPLVNNVNKHQMAYISRITELAAARSKFYMTYDFTCLSLKGMTIIDNEKLKKLDIPGKIEYLTKSFDSLYNTTKIKNKLIITDCFSFKGYEKILASNYIQGKRIDRKHWKKYTKGILPNIHLFYLELAALKGKNNSHK